MGWMISSIRVERHEDTLAHEAKMWAGDSSSPHQTILPMI
jgi:hypothetical protein